MLHFLLYFKVIHLVFPNLEVKNVKDVLTLLTNRLAIYVRGNIKTFKCPKVDGWIGLLYSNDYDSKCFFNYKNISVISRTFDFPYSLFTVVQIGVWTSAYTYPGLAVSRSPQKNSCIIA